MAEKLDLSGHIDGRADVVCPAGRSLGEGALWCPIRRKLLWIDIARGKIFTYDEADHSNEFVDIRQSVGTVVPLDETHVVAAIAKGVCILDLTKKGGAIFDRFLGNPCDSLVTRYNDGKCDNQGRLWVGTMGCFCEEEAGSLYSFEIDADTDKVIVKKHLEGVTVSNGIVWTADSKTMYYIDTPTLKVDAFDFDAKEGAISKRRTVIEIPPDIGYPDGCTIDAEGMLWIAFWQGWSVQRWDPNTGKRLAAYHLPCAQVTSCAFGGEHLDQLYVTTANCGLSKEELEAQPEAGHLFKIDLSEEGIRGVPASVFGKGV